MAPAKRILVIDDERRMADSVCQLLSREGYQATPCHSGRAGLQRLEEQTFDVVVTDLKMPDIDGLTLIRHMRERRPETLVIVMTGHASTESAIEALQQAVFDYVAKPFDFSRLLTSIERAFQRLETERLRADMISMISHDIKVPLTSIIGYTSLMRNRRSGDWHPRAEEFLNIIASNANKILALLDNYLTTCKIEAGRLTLQRTTVRLRELFAELESVFAPEADKRNIRIAIECPQDLPVFEGDESLVYRALCNLANNALKYSPPGSTVVIRALVRPAAESPLARETVTVEVDNPGQGIPPDELPQIFDRYHRAQSSQGVEGSGIGLFVVKTVVEAHGGSVAVESTPNVLTRVTMHLPLVPPAAAE